MHRRPTLTLIVGLVSLTVMGCDGNTPTGEPPAGGTLVVSTATTGLDLDPDGYRLVVDGSDQGAISPNDTVTLVLEAGNRTIALAGLAPNCALEPPAPLTVTIATYAFVGVKIRVICTATSGVIKVALAASGLAPGVAFQGTVDGERPFSVHWAAPTYLEELPVGDHAISLNRPANCSGATDSQPVAVTVGTLIRDTAEVVFSVVCSGPARPRIAFVRRGQPGSDGMPGPPDIYLANTDGSEAARLTAGMHPAWSSDGRKIAFYREGMIHVIDADGSNERSLVRGSFPAWSPDGTRIVFAQMVYNTGVGFSGGIFVMNADGSRLTLLIPHDFANPGSGIDWTGWPEWSPDGRISFVRTAGYDYEPWRVYVMNDDGSDPRILNVSPLRPQEHAWSPDGSRIAGVTSDAGRIGSVDSSGGDFRTHYDGGIIYAGHPDWSPDGRSIVFEQFKTTVGCDTPACPMRIYLVSIEGGPASQLIPELKHAPDYWDEEPAWSRVNE